MTVQNIIYCQGLKCHFKLVGHATMAKQINLSLQMDKLNSFIVKAFILLCCNKLVVT
jgi:hypothetical protein